MTAPASRLFTEQFLNFHINLEGRAWAESLSDEENELIWNKSDPVLRALHKLVAEGNEALPGYRVPFHEGQDSYLVESWELCEDDFTESQRQGLACYCISFHHSAPFTQEQVRVLLKFMQDAAQAVGERFGMKVSVVEVETQTRFITTEYETLPLA